MSAAETVATTNKLRDVWAALLTVDAAIDSAVPMGSYETRRFNIEAALVTLRGAACTLEDLVGELEGKDADMLARAEVRAEITDDGNNPIHLVPKSALSEITSNADDSLRRTARHSGARQTTKRKAG